jgi:hypothetical protein
MLGHAKILHGSFVAGYSRRIMARLGPKTFVRYTLNPYPRAEAV